MKNSLQLRLSSGLTLSLILLFLLMWFAVDTANRRLTREFVATRLGHDSELLLSELKINPRGLPIVRPRHTPPIYTRPFSGHYYRIDLARLSAKPASDHPPPKPHHPSRQGEGGWAYTLLSESLAGKEFPAPSSLGPPDWIGEIDGPDGQRLLARYRRENWQGYAVHLAVAEDLSPMTVARDRFSRAYIWVSGAALLLLVLIQALVVHRSLRPLNRTREQIQQLERGELTQLGLDVPYEVLPLVVEVNQLVDGINLRLERSRKALGNLTHALKTPLTLLTDLADRPEFENYPELQAEMTQRIQAIREIMDRELKRARLAGQYSAGSGFTASEEIPPLIQALKQMYRDKGLHIDTRIPDDLRCSADRQDVMELLGNLLDNACKWARSRVLLTLLDHPGLAFSVEDDGPGVPGQQRRDLARRGTRIDEQPPGHGLGLSIVGDIVEAYGGNMTLDRSEELGGFRVDIILPCSELQPSINSPPNSA